MTPDNEQLRQIQQISQLKSSHVADLIRAAQLIIDPGSGVSGRVVNIDWQEIGIPVEVEENLRILGEQYRYSLPDVEIDAIWKYLTPETRRWFMENKSTLWQIEESLPALDED